MSNMVMPAILGTVSDGNTSSGGGGGGSAPTSVSVATSSSGNYDNSFTTAAVLGSALTTDGSSNTMSIAKELYDSEYGSAGLASFYVRGYLRATGGTSYTMNAAMNGDSSLSGGCSVSITGNSTSTQQDNTTGSGLGTVTIAHGGGRGGIVTPSVNDFVRVKVNGSATNSNGTTNATERIQKLKWVS